MLEQALALQEISVTVEEFLEAPRAILTTLATARRLRVAYRYHLRRQRQLDEKEQAEAAWRRFCEQQMAQQESP